MSAPPGDPTSAPGPTGRPPGDGWDDGRGGRAKGGSGGRSRNPWAGQNSRIPRWLIPAVVVLVLLVVVLVIVLGGGDDEAADSGTCVEDLVAELEIADAGHLAITDVVQARSAGYDDEGELEAAGDSLDTSGAVPDGLTAEIRFGRLDSVEEFTGSTGVDPGDIECSARSRRTTVLGGTFDPAEVEGTDLAAGGRLAATEDRLALVGPDGDASALVEPADDPLGDDEDVTTVVASLREAGAYSALLDWDAESDGARAAGLGVAGSGDDRQLVVAWSFADDDAAKAGRRLVAETINAVARGSASVATDDLVVDGSLITAVVDVRKPPNLSEQWDLGTTLLDR